jgi:hypothetical protein
LQNSPASAGLFAVVWRQYVARRFLSVSLIFDEMCDSQSNKAAAVDPGIRNQLCKLAQLPIGELYVDWLHS